MGEMNTVPLLFTNKEDCCGCSACLNNCPKQAISMREDEYGFLYPFINESLCIRCGKCKKVCAFQNNGTKNSPMDCYAAINRNKNQAIKSASGGIFAAIAETVIKNDGIIYGAAFSGNWGVHHISVDKLEDLIALQGSKYAHSEIGRIFHEVKDELQTGRQVLFSGTPCQIDGLKAYLGEEYENLVTVDIVCHGVPSVRMFQAYLKTLEKKYGGEITSFSFRDKSIGWGKNGTVVINGKKIKIWESASSYLYYFSQGNLFRPNCYKCPYACSNRPADLTIGDYWGIEKQHPEIFAKRGWDETKGISLIIVNTKKGKKALENCRSCIEVEPSSFRKISAGNKQLNHPSIDISNGEITHEFENGGWENVENRFRQNRGLRLYLSQIKSIIPTKLKRILKRYL